MTLKEKTQKEKACFTLLELILVIAIISILLGTTFPLINKKVKSAALKSFADEVFFLLDYARSRAILNNHQTEIVFEFDQGILYLADSSLKPPNQQESEDLDIIKKIYIPEKINIESDNSRVIFFPDGTSVEFNIAISNKDKSILQISSDGFDGRIKIQ
ncbi:MAG: GspH/FimT family pseudopilin [Candidatus Omnitrophica bacterium]|nr:GspH/FimT family pseudopilin [Candidatus Omnitrophota bacterium]